MVMCMCCNIVKLVVVSLFNFQMDSVALTRNCVLVATSMCVKIYVRISVFEGTIKCSFCTSVFDLM